MGAKSSKVAGCVRKAYLWKADRSPACRCVMMVVDAIQLNVTEIDLNLDKGDHRCPEITQLNPQQTLPIFRDKDVVLTDSHVIGSYLASRYCGDTQLYPKNATARALQDQWLHYNNGVIYPRFRAAVYPMLYDNCGYILPSVIREIEATYCHLEGALVGNSYFGGAYASLADIALVSTVSSLNVIVPVDSQRFPQLCSWLYLMAQESYYKTANIKGLEEFCYRLAACATTYEAVGQTNSISRREATNPVRKKRFQGIKLRLTKSRLRRKNRRQRLKNKFKRTIKRVGGKEKTSKLFPVSSSSLRRYQVVTLNNEVVNKNSKVAK